MQSFPKQFKEGDLGHHVIEFLTKFQMQYRCYIENSLHFALQRRALHHSKLDRDPDYACTACCAPFILHTAETYQEFSGNSVPVYDQGHL